MTDTTLQTGQPATMKGPTKFWDRIADGYAAKPVADEASYQEKLRVTREFLTPDSTVVEFGCGTGSTAIAHAPHAKSILATDISARMIEIAREKAEAAGASNVSFAQASIEEMAVPDASVDMVMGHSILHLVADRHAVLERVRKMLKPGGVFVSSTVCLGTWKMAWFRVVGPIGRILGFFPLVRVFSAGQLAQDIQRAGFEIERQWRPKDGITLFVVARKPGTATS